MSSIDDSVHNTANATAPFVEVTKTMTYDNVVLIGPAGVGKSTTACLLAERMGRPHVALDKERFRYYAEIGYNADLAGQLRQTNFEELIRYYEPFNAYAVCRVLEDYSGSIIDFGAIHSVYDNTALFHQAQEALEPYPHVILLLPCPEIDQSLEILMERGRAGEQMDERKEALWRRIIRRFLENPSNEALAKNTIYTEGKNPEGLRLPSSTVSSKCCYVSAATVYCGCGGCCVFEYIGRSQ